jgi:twitching motility protein PilT
MTHVGRRVRGAGAATGARFPGMFVIPMVAEAPNSGQTPFTSEAYFHQLLQKAVAAGASDVHLKVGQPPGARVGGNLVFFRVDKLRRQDTEAVARLLLRSARRHVEVDELKEYDLPYEIAGIGRFRVNVYRQRGTLAVVMRVIAPRVPTLEELGAPAACRPLALKDRGLVLCVGAAGNGKSTTLAAMIDLINHTMHRHIVTIEDPVEYLHEDDLCSISQREIGSDSVSFASALRAALRQDPDVIQVGEIRDGETMDIALKAAETGHLVLSTLHTPDVARTVNRIMALAEGGDADELRERLGGALQGIIAQRLLPRADGKGRVLAAEVLVCTGSVRETIKRPEGNPPLKELMEQGSSMYGMQTFEMHVKELIRDGVVDREVGRAAMGF